MFLIQLGLYLAWTSSRVSRKDLISMAMVRFSLCLRRKKGVISSFSLLYEYLIIRRSTVMVINTFILFVGLFDFFLSQSCLVLCLVLQYLARFRDSIFTFTNRIKWYKSDEVFCYYFNAFLTFGLFLCFFSNSPPTLSWIFNLKVVFLFFMSVLSSFYTFNPRT